MRNLLIVMSGPSGVGKGTIVKRLKEEVPNLVESVSCTTRAPREGEIDGKSYFFIDKTKFLSMVDKRGFLEYSNHFDNYYGTPKFFVNESLKTCDVILEIDVDGGLNVKNTYPDALLIMIAPPNDVALAQRLRGRGSETEEVIAKRLARMKYELSQSDKYDFVVVNDDLDEAVNEVKNIIINEKIKGEEN